MSGEGHDCARDGHLWTGAEPCAGCGIPWSEVYSMRITEFPGGVTIVRVVDADADPEDPPRRYDPPHG